jgi:hypothetical protein
MKRFMGKSAQVGLAIGSDRITAVVPGTALTASVEVAVTAETDSRALTHALFELQRSLAAAAGQSFDFATVDVALMPPLYEARLIPLPPVSNAEARMILQRDAGRHFVSGAIARAIAVEMPPRDSNLPAFAVAAPATFLELMHSAATSIGWQVRRIVPAIAAWLHAADAAATPRGSSRLIVAASTDVVHVLRVETAPVQLRRVPVDALDDLAAAAGNGPGYAWVWGEADSRAAVEQMLARLGWQLQPLSLGQHDSQLAAAHHAGHGKLELIPQSLAVAQSSYQRALALRLAGIAALLVLGAGAVELWGAQRELASLRAQRAEIRKDVTPLLAMRDSVAALEQRVSQVDALKGDGPGITAALFDLAMLLPEDAHLRSLHATGDTLVMEAAGSRAGLALEAVRSSSALRDVRLKGTVEREMQSGETTAERFTFAARLGWRDSTESKAPAAVKRSATTRASRSTPQERTP